MGAMKRFINWYTLRNWKDECIFAKDLETIIMRAKLNEQARIEERFREEKDSIIRQFEIQRTIEISELNAQLNRLQSELDDLKSERRRVEEVHYLNVERANMNSVVAAEMADQAKKLRDMAANIYGTIEGVKKHAVEHVERIRDEESEVKEKLKLLKFNS
jgi:regulator of replication initiation timing